MRIGLIGAGKFATMFLHQARGQPGVHLVAVVDLRSEGAKSKAGRQSSMARPRWKRRSGRGATRVGAMLCHPGIEIVIECTGNPVAAVDHCLAAFAQGKHVINVTVEAFVGVGLAQRAGVIYSMVYGDQPSSVCDLVDWARTCGFPVTAAGRGHKWLPHFRQSTPPRCGGTGV